MNTNKMLNNSCIDYLKFYNKYLSFSIKYKSSNANYVRFYHKIKTFFT